MQQLTTELKTGLSRALSPPKVYYPHYCYDCMFNYFGDVEGKVIPCPKCKGRNVTDYRGYRLINEKTNR